MSELARLKGELPIGRRTQARPHIRMDSLQPLLDAMSEHAAVLDDFGKIVAVNTAWRDFGESQSLKLKDHGVGTNYLAACDSVVSEDVSDSAAIAQGIREVLDEKRQAYEHEYTCHSATEERWFLVRASPLRWFGRTYVLVTHTNITSFRQAETALRHNQERFRLLLETTRAIPWEADAETWRFTFVGPQALSVLGYPLDQWYEKDFWTSHIHPEDREFATDFCAKASRKCTSFEFEYRMLSAKGDTIWLHDLVSCICHNGQPNTLRGFMIDISERKKAEHAHHESDQRMRTLFDCAREAMIIFDVDAARFVDVNDNAVRLFGVSRDLLLRMNPFHLRLTPRIQPNGRLSKEYGREKLQEALSGNTPHFEWVHHDKMSKPVTCEVQIVRLPYRGKNLVRLSITDITLRRQAEAKVREQHDKLQLQRQELRDLAAQLITVQDEERRRMACELHDDASQRLALVAQRISLLQRDLPRSPRDMSRQLEELRGQVVRTSTDVRRLAHELHPSVLDDLGLEVATQSYAEEFSRHQGMTVTFRAGHIPKTIPRDAATCLYRVMQESLGNAAKHARTTVAKVSLKGCHGGILLAVRDWGVGYAEPTLKKSRDGLGLVSMRERARLVNGTLSVRSKPGKGTRVRCWVPLGGAGT